MKKLKVKVFTNVYDPSSSSNNNVTYFIEKIKPEDIINVNISSDFRGTYTVVVIYQEEEKNENKKVV